MMFKFLNNEKYHHVEDQEHLQGLIPGSTPDVEATSSGPLDSLSGGKSIIVLVVVSFIAAFLGVLLGRRYHGNDGAIRHVSKYSPIMDDVDVGFHTIQFDGRFVQENVYRQGAGPEVDAAWEALGIGYGPLVLPESLAAKAGMTKDHVRIKEKYGGGIPVFVEGMHQLHCLNLVRQSLFYNYDYYHSRAEGAFSDSERVQRWHVSHCLDMIRQRLMCTVDIGVFGSVWVNATSPHTFVDFNTKHVCRDFETIRKWAEERQISEDVPGDFFDVPIPGEANGVKIFDIAP